MRIGYFADGPWAHRALDRIIASPELELAMIVARNSAPDPVLRDYADRLGVPFLTDPNVNSPSFIAGIEDFAADLHVSMSFDQILKAEIIGSAPGGFINCHAGALPFYRGRNVLNWALINGAEEIGVTVHFVDEGIDTGDIVAQGFAPVGLDDDYGSLLEKAVELCADTLEDALLQISAGTAERRPQRDVHPVGFYCSTRREGDEWIDWSWTSKRVYDLIRAIAPPGPGARTYLGDARLAVLRAELIDSAPAYIDRPGTVVGRDPAGVVVKTGDATVRLTAVAELGDGGLGEPAVPAFSIGTVLGVNPWIELERTRQRLAELEARLGGPTEAGGGRS